MIRQGSDKEVMSLLYKKVLPQLKSYILKNNGNRDDAYDVFHDALMLFYEQVIEGTYNEKYAIYGYLYRIAVFRWINKVKKQRSLVLMEEPPEMDMSESWERYEAAQSGQENDILSTLFAKLGDKCIELLNYTIYSDMLMEDVMLRMGFASVDAVRMQHMRCKQKILKELEENPILLKKLKRE